MLIVLLRTLFITIVSTLLKKLKWIYRIWKTLGRDVREFWKLSQIFLRTKWMRIINKPIYYYFNETVKKHPHKAAYLFEEERWSFLDVRNLANKIALYFEREGYTKGDTIALLLSNCPDYIPIWLGLSRIGVPTALINTNLVGDSLLHCIKVAKSKAIIFGENFQDRIPDLANKLDLKCYQYSRKVGANSFTPNSCVNLTSEISNIDPSEPLNKTYSIRPTDTVLYIYTSGTTGLPKPAVLSHARLQGFLIVFKTIFPKLEESVLYTPFPLFHGSGGVIGSGQALCWGTTVVLKTKFSATNYWRDCVKYNCNIGQYIGETCRYILHSTPEGNSKHPVKIMFGNGLKPQIWGEFQKKFNIKQINEFYAATEGNFFFVNTENKLGSVGSIPTYLQNYASVQLITFSEETEEPFRDADGFCIKSGVNEPGLAIGRISSPKGEENTVLEFMGYLNPDDTEKKILHNVFKKGDKYFNSGDVLSRDEFGYYYFVDRLGDTFRWKGENVSTVEVEAIISNYIGLKDAVAYGVTIPGCEGRAGMVAIAENPASIDMDAFLEKLKGHLPMYAIPIFLRFKSFVAITFSNKFQKFNLKKEGFDINSISDDVYFYNKNVDKYMLLTQTIYDDIINGKVRF